MTYEDYQYMGLWEQVFNTFARYPYLRDALEHEFDRRAALGSLQTAAAWLKTFEHNCLQLPIDTLNLNSTDHSVRNQSDALAAKCNRAFTEEIEPLKKRGATPEYREKAAVRIGQHICNGATIDFPLSQKDADNQSKIIAALARLCSAKWWRRKLRTLLARQLETACRELGLVNKRCGGYVSLLTLSRRQCQRHRNRELLESLEATNEDRQTFTLAELSDLGVSNPANRRAELMTRLSGFEVYAQSHTSALTPLFFTLTCPARFHSHNRGGERYDKWNGETPREAQQHLCNVWAKTRAAWQRVNIGVFGFRIAEPHHDGCPHWHVVLWVPCERIIEASAIFRGYALEESPDEPGADLRRLKIDYIDQKKGSATGYIAKYVSKNIDGLTDNGDAWSSDSVRTALRVEAWASTWGIRQFQQIGGPSVTVWRELRRLDESQTISIPDLPEIVEAHQAADQGNWNAFTHAMGGAICRRDERPLRPLYTCRMDDEHNLTCNEYGEAIKAITGLLAANQSTLTTRLHHWIVSKIKPVVEEVVLFARAPPGALLPLDLCQ